VISQGRLGVLTLAPAVAGLIVTVCAAVYWRSAMRRERMSPTEPQLRPPR
jgi:hypothetical protein